MSKEWQGHQGDIFFRRIDKIPNNVEKIDPVAGKGLVVAEGEATGHFHLFGDTDTATMFQGPNPRQKFVELQAPQELVHDEHKKISFEPGLYELRQKRVHTREGVSTLAD